MRLPATSARKRQVRRALAAERSRQRRTTDEEIAAYRRWVKRAFPGILVLYALLTATMIYRGAWAAIPAYVAVLPSLWLSWWMIRLAERRDDERAAATARKAWALLNDDDAVVGPEGADLGRRARDDEPDA